MSDARSIVVRPPAPFNRGTARPQLPDMPLKHVIDEYHHREQVVTCVCGWHGSSASDPGHRSAWDEHKAVFRITSK